MLSFAGPAFPIQGVPTREEPIDPYSAEIAAVDAVPAGAVLCFATGAVYDAAAWGELLATRAKAKGAVGAVIDGAARDIAALVKLGFLTFAAEINANDALGRLGVVSHGAPIVCGEVGIRSGDLVVGDPDGVIVVPKAVISEVLRSAQEKEVKEIAAMSDLLDGGTIEAVWARYGIL
jgi:regulator of RNase E activity RraA